MPIEASNLSRLLPPGLPPLSGQDLLHPLNGPNASRMMPTYNVFAEQEKAFFKRTGVPQYEAARVQASSPASSVSSTTSMYSSPQPSPTSANYPQGISSPAVQRPTTISSSSSSSKYNTVPQYRTATSSSSSSSRSQANAGPSNQFGVLVPGWGAQQDRAGVPARNGSSTAGMQFVPVATKGSGAPGRGPTKRKKA